MSKRYNITGKRDIGTQSEETGGKMHLFTINVIFLYRLPFVTLIYKLHDFRFWSQNIEKLQTKEVMKDKERSPAVPALSMSLPLR